MRKRQMAAWASVLLAVGAHAKADWDTYQNDANHDGYVPGVFSSAAPKVLWSTSLPSGSLTDMAVGGGNVYVSSDLYFGSGVTPNFFALNTATGAVSWQYNVGSVFSENAPAYSNGVVYMQAGKGTSSPANPLLYSFNAGSGAVISQSVFGAQWEHYLSPTVVNGGIYIDGGYYGGMYAFNVSNGTQKWFGTMPQYDGWTPAVANGMCYAYAGYGFYTLNASTGATVVTTPDSAYSWTGYTMNEAPALGSLNDAFVTNGGRLLKFGTTAAGGLLATIADQYSGQPSVAHGHVYVEDGSTLVSLTESTLAKQWTWTPPDGDALLGRDIVTDNLVFTSTSADVYAISLATGQTAWSVPASGNLALSGNTLYVSSSSGTVTAIAVPEPALGTVLMAGAAILSMRRRCKRGLDIGTRKGH